MTPSEIGYIKTINTEKEGEEICCCHKVIQLNEECYQCMITEELFCLKCIEELLI